ncbi:biotin/lipoyl-binding protein [Sansalvadorimonas sp. 2012CJ34-2]|uniref:Biotin/lipoyl-binding protein n=1 Tax=Parendozoicomonas callyspongiae TaxID=2942213 RepID=A0ABT0PBJ5_9GAMM|nr:HlyD family efflux transporter periplasmic adaptor subunit [Sansalvadorimonas sp. 2012CJ34-2]MCL6268626.1 biotin/lipoyl-binding protein [Sansalvadorimonas sp. 2012CJ34-2]
MPSALIQRLFYSRWKWSLLIVMVTILLIIFLFSTAERPKPAKARQSEWSVRVMPVSFEAQSVEATLYGRVETPAFVSLASPVTAYVKQVHALEGQAVNNDELVVELDSRDQELVVAQRKADVADIEARLKSEQLRGKMDREALRQEKILLDNAEKEKNRQEVLQQKNLVSEAILETAIGNHARQKLTVLGREQMVNDASNRLKQLEAQHSRAQALLEQAKLDLERSRVAAPFSGVVSQLKVAKGERVRPGDVLLEMYDTEQLEIRAQIPDRFLPVVQNLIESGTQVSALLRTGGNLIPLELNRLAGSVDSGRGGVDGLFRLAQGQAKPLIYGRVRVIELQVPLKEQVVKVPPDALYRDRYIYRVNSQSQLEAIEVDHLGSKEENGQEWLLVQSSELKEDDQLLVTRIASAISGMKVKVKTENSSPAEGNNQSDQPGQAGDPQ